MGQRHRDGLNGSITIEMAYIMPLILLVFFLSVLGIFYYHDKNILSGCAYETAVIGSTKAREKDGVTEDVLAAVFKERSRGKCIMFTGAQASFRISNREIRVFVSAVRRGMKISCEQSAAVTEPEKYIRDIKRLK